MTNYNVIVICDGQVVTVTFTVPSHDKLSHKGHN